MAEFNLKNIKNMQFEFEMDGMKILCDQPVDNYGDGEYLSPVPIFVSSVAMCAATYGGFFYKKNNIPMDNFKVTGSYEAEYSKKARIKSINLKIFSPDIPEKDRKKFEAFVNQCLIVNTIKDSLEITKEFFY
ncbi:MAG: OsmC family protein [Candidatus Muiribacteriota bacterium]